MNSYHLNWLFNELKKWEEKNVISSDISQKIHEYYEEEKKLEEQQQIKLAEENEKKKQEAVQKLPLIFSLIAAFLIGTGIISLIAFNWHLISREIKTCGAFILAVLPGILYSIFYLKNKNLSVQINEFLGVLWAILAGGMIEFIIQIYKIPQDPAVTLFLWFIASVLIQYATKATGTFYISVALMISTVITAQFAGELHTAVFYPAIISLIPSAKENRKRIYILTFSFFLLLGFALEKMMPGLWIPSYVSAITILLFIAKEKKENVLFYSALIGIFIMLVLMSIPEMWNDIGWNNLRLDKKHSTFISVIDYASTILLLITSIALPSYSLFKNRNASLVHSVSLLPFFTATFYVLCAFFPELNEFSMIFVYVVLSVFTVLGGLFFKGIHFYALPAILCILGFASVQILASPFFVTVIFLFLAISSFRKNNSSIEAKWIKPALFVFTVISYFIFTLGFHDEKFENEQIISFLIIFSINILSAIFFTVKNFYLIKTKNLKTDVFTLIPVVLLNYIIFQTVLLKDVVSDYEGIILLIPLLLLALFSYIVWNRTKLNEHLSVIGIFFFHLLSLNKKFDLGTSCILLTLTAFLFNHGFTKNAKAYFIALTLIPLSTFFEYLFSYAEVQTFQVAVFCRYISLIFILGISVIIPLYKSFKIKAVPQLGINLVALLYIFMELFFPNGYSNVTHTIFFTLYFVFGIQEIILAFKTSSIKQMNLFTAYLSILLIKEFLLQPVSLIVRGIVFIAIGIAVMILNVFFSKKIKMDKNRNSSEGELLK